METTIADLRWKEVISVADGTRFGYVEDMEVDMESGQVRCLVVIPPMNQKQWDRSPAQPV